MKNIGFLSAPTTNETPKGHELLIIIAYFPFKAVDVTMAMITSFLFHSLVVGAVYIVLSLKVLRTARSGT